MRITKFTANEIARKLVENKHSELEILNSKITDAISFEYISFIPEKVNKLFLEYPDYVVKRDHVTLDSEGFNFERFYFPESLPFAKFELTKTFAKKFRKMIDSRDQVKKEIDDLCFSIENALLQLKTYKAIEENFPEAVPYLPKNNAGVFLPALNIDSIRQKLK